MTGGSFTTTITQRYKVAMVVDQTKRRGLKEDAWFKVSPICLKIYFMFFTVPLHYHAPNRSLANEPG